ncbi:MAG: hypothetical protein IJR90_01710 [Clostridia bacterium]|nr:hypothetical protein [Clostridia bacterium]
MFETNYAKRLRERVDCPVCGEEDVDRLYFDLRGDCFGCDCCVYSKDADVYADELINGKEEKRKENDV